RRRHTIFSRDWSSDVSLPIYEVVGGGRAGGVELLQVELQALVVVEEGRGVDLQAAHEGLLQAEFEGVDLFLVGFRLGRQRAEQRSEERRVGKGWRSWC